MFCKLKVNNTVFVKNAVDVTIQNAKKVIKQQTKTKEKGQQYLLVQKKELGLFYDDSFLISYCIRLFSFKLSQKYVETSEVLPRC